MPEIPKIYEPKKYEDEIYKRWEESGFFNPDNLDLPKDAENYAIIMPPPNVTGVLHMGSAMMLAVEDLLIRYNRMQGKRTLWIPGTDHAAIATQNRVEKNLRQEGLTRHDLGREKFLEKVEEFAKNSQKTIISQIRKMGSSCDWSRLAYTLDETRATAVKEVFIKMHKDGLIYRGKRIVNWCPRCHSTLANDEVEYEKEIGKLYWIKYGPFVLATTRPETKLGDTAVAVHPKDKRYTDMVGKKYMIPGVLGEFEIVVVADRAVDPEFGSGAVKVTPAHDFTDNGIASRHNIPMKQIIDEDGKMMKNCGKYAGMTTKDARTAIVADMEKMGLIDHIEDNYEHNISVCYRCGTQIEPIPSLQWFIDVNKKILSRGKSIKELSGDAVKKGVFGRQKISIIPGRFEKNYFHWMDNLEDWCVSRQIWFGHRLPVWYRNPQPLRPDDYVGTPPLSTGEGEIYVGESAPEGEGWTQDQDTLDTWFSSGLWSFSTMAHSPKEISSDENGIEINSEDFKKFHPTAVLETMYDILFFWVARMIIMTTYNVGDIPFQEVYLHGCVRDKFGDKMSKSNPETNIDPLDVCEKYGTDAVRLSLLIGTTPGSDLKVYDEKIEALRNFITKLWNIYRFSATTFPDFKLEEKIAEQDIKTLADRWIVSKLQTLTQEVTDDLEKYKFSLAGEKLQNFIWNELADWYLEISKVEKNDYVIGYVINYVIRLLHPFAPFVTEKIYMDLNENKSASSADKMLMVAKWPTADKKLIDKKAEKEFETLQATIGQIRNLRSSYKIDPARVITAYGTVNTNQEIIEKLARVKITNDKAPTKTIKVADLELDISELIDTEKEKARLQKEIENLEKLVANTQKLLSNEKFVKSAPRDVVELNENNLEEYKNKLEGQKELLGNLG